MSRNELLCTPPFQGFALWRMGRKVSKVFDRVLWAEECQASSNYISNFAIARNARYFEMPRSYRSLLDHWRMFHARAHFDIARGKHAETAADMVPPQVYVRCNYCSQSIAHSLWIT